MVLVNVITFQNAFNKCDNFSLTLFSLLEKNHLRVILRMTLLCFNALKGLLLCEFVLYKQLIQGNPQVSPSLFGPTFLHLEFRHHQHQKHSHASCKFVPPSPPEIQKMILLNSLNVKD